MCPNNLLVDKRTDLCDMQLRIGAIEERLCICYVEDGDSDEYVQGRFLEQVVEEGGFVH